jgi:hypothetical protein
MNEELSPETESLLEQLAVIRKQTKEDVLDALILEEANRLGLDYNADSIRILQPEEAEERFEWLKIQQLANQYHCTTEWIERGLEACWRAGVPKSYFISRYLDKDSTVPVNPLVSEAFRELLHEKSGETQ